MRRGTTPSHVFNVDVDLTEATIFLTYCQGGKTVLEKTNEDLDITADSITVYLSQEDTLKFKDGVPVEIQLRYVTPSGKADASNIMLVGVERILKDGEITSL